MNRAQTSLPMNLIAKLPEQIKRGKATLVLFSSYWQMDKVVTALREKQN